MSRLELFKEDVLIDTIHVHRYKREELNELLVEMGQPRDTSLSWEKINAEKDFTKMLNNYSAYHDITMTEEERAAEEVAQKAEKKAAKEAAKAAAAASQQSEEL